MSKKNNTGKPWVMWGLVVLVIVLLTTVIAIFNIGGDKLRAGPTQDDMDGDGITDLNDPDRDGDGLENLDEAINGTDPDDPDSDDDGYGDMEEAIVLDGDGPHDPNDPNDHPDWPVDSPDLDGDGLPDIVDDDDDGDGLSDDREREVGTDPRNTDSNDNGLSDLEEEGTLREQIRNTWEDLSISQRETVQAWAQEQLDRIDRIDRLREEYLNLLREELGKRRREREENEMSSSSVEEDAFDQQLDE